MTAPPPETAAGHVFAARRITGRIEAGNAGCAVGGNEADAAGAAHRAFIFEFDAEEVLERVDAHAVVGLEAVRLAAPEPVPHGGFREVQPGINRTGEHGVSHLPFAAADAVGDRLAAAVAKHLPVLSIEGGPTEGKTLVQ